MPDEGGVGAILILPLCLFAFLAGLVDSVVGGGGLIQLPALFIFLPGALPATVFGTNKLSSVFGTGFALRQYARHVTIDWRVAGPAAGAAFAFAWLGARAVSHVHPSHLRPIILVLLIAVANLLVRAQGLRARHAPRLAGRRQLGYALGTGVLLGFYDGFFGPGTGSFLMFALIGLFGYDFLSASASAKVVNVATNLAALLYFAATRHIDYAVALPMAACNVLGARAGTSLAIARGSRFVRALFLVVVTVIILEVRLRHVSPVTGPNETGPVKNLRGKPLGFSSRPASRTGVAGSPRPAPAPATGHSA